MNADGKKNLFISENLDNYIKKKRDEITKENRKIHREESVLKKRKEKMLNSSSDLNGKQITDNLFLENNLNFKNQMLTLDQKKSSQTL